MIRPAARRRVFAPEVIQTSAMDCGPAALKCLLEGFGVAVSYGRLREACQTDVDGTSIDTLEELAKQLGLDAEQVMLPLDHLLRAESDTLPALVVVKLPTGFTHFVVVWRRHGRFVQVMDPASGRRWLGSAQFLKDVYVHELRVPAAAWYEWARSEEFLAPLDRRLVAVGLGHAAQGLLKEATESPDWSALATLDAATHLTASLIRARGIVSGREASGVLRALLDRARAPGSSDSTDLLTIPSIYWSARPAPAIEGDSTSPIGEEIHLKGAVLIRVRGRLSHHAGATTPSAQDAAADAAAPPDTTHADAPSPLSPELAAALAEPPSRPGRELLRLLQGDGIFSFSVLAGGLMLASGSVVLEALILRGALDLAHALSLISQRLLAAGYFLAFALALLLVELQVTGALLRLGRRLENRLRIAWLEKIPRLLDQYFRSRPVSDMAERGHSIHQLRVLPRLGGQLVRAALTLLATGVAIAWLYPPGTPMATLAVIGAVGLPLAFQPHLQELDLRVRTHTGALSRFYLDALLGLTALRAHGAERAVRREQENLLVEWSDASLRLVRSNLTLEGLQAIAGFGLAILLLLFYAEGGNDPGGALLLAYWALNIPILGEEVALLVRQYPIHRNLTLRLLEPLGAPAEVQADHAHAPLSAGAPGDPRRPDDPAPTSAPAQGATIRMESVTVYAAGHPILRDIDLTIDAGRHIAIVGASGAGKSSLVGLLLGWHRAAHGRVLIDDNPLDTARLDLLRQATVWIDPSVQVWNRALLANLSYGSDRANPLVLSWALAAAELFDTVERLPEGLQTRLGEGGGLVSGGEGQRVRIARGLCRPAPRLVILDEPFRGLGRAQRRDLLDRIRERWQNATLLCITHDVGQTLGFERVLVVDLGRIVEDAHPEILREDPASRYRTLLDADRGVRIDLGANTRWRRLRLDGGKLHETHGPG